MEAAAAEARRHPGDIPRPQTAVGGRIFWRYLSVFIAFHVLALLAFVPYFFSWTGVILVFVGNYFFGSMGINVGYHRLLTHRSFACPLWLERIFVVCGVCSLEDSPGRWVAVHRMHHQHSDVEEDPHSPMVNFFWGHAGWLIVENKQIATLDTFAKYAPDVFRDPFYRWLHRRHMWITVYAIHALIILALGYLAGWLLYGTVEGMTQFALSIFVWGVIVRTVYVWHITWAVNSLSHRFGYRNYNTGEESRNNWFVALLTNGEGWHNNHHADPRSAAHGHRWWEVDVTYATLALLTKVGLVKELLPPRVPERLKFAPAGAAYPLPVDSVQAARVSTTIPDDPTNAMTETMEGPVGNPAATPSPVSDDAVA